MASVNAFNEMMEQFLVELHKTLPEEKGIKTFMNSFQLLKDTNPRMCVDMYMKAVSPYADKISQKDETFFLNEIEKIDYLAELNIKHYWNDKLSQGTRDAIWQYLQTLYMLGTTISAIPQETLSMIENIAKDCADKMGDGNGNLDEAALMKTMNSLFSGMMKK